MTEIPLALGAKKIEIFRKEFNVVDLEGVSKLTMVDIRRTYGIGLETLLKLKFFFIYYDIPNDWDVSKTGIGYPDDDIRIPVEKFRKSNFRWWVMKNYLQEPHPRFKWAMKPRKKRK